MEAVGDDARGLDDVVGVDELAGGVDVLPVGADDDGGEVGAVAEVVEVADAGEVAVVGGWPTMPSTASARAATSGWSSSVT